MGLVKDWPSGGERTHGEHSNLHLVFVLLLVYTRPTSSSGWCRCGCELKKRKKRNSFHMVVLSVMTKKSEMQVLFDEKKASLH